MAAEKVFKIFTSKLNVLNRKSLLFLFLSSFFKFLAISSIVYFFAIVLEANLYFSSKIKTVLNVFIFLSAVALFVYLFKAFFRFLFFTEKSTLLKKRAFHIGSNYPEVKDRLLNAFEIYSQKENLKNIYSPSLINEVVSRDVKPYLDYNFDIILDRKSLKKDGLRLLVVTAVIFLLSIPFSGDLARAYKRLVNPNGSVSLPAAGIEVYPAGTTVIYGDSLDITVKLRDTGLENLAIFIKKESQFDFDAFDLDGSRTFRLANIKEQHRYFVSGDKRITRFRSRKIKSDEFSISVIQRPMVKSLRCEIRFPDYTGIQDSYLEENIGDIYAIKGSQASIKFESNKIIKNAFLDFEKSKDLSFEIFGKKGSVNFPVMKGDKYRVILQDTAGIFNIDPIEYRVTTSFDEPPFVTISQPGRDIDLGDDQLLPLAIKIGDDFGITKMSLHYKKIYDDGDESGEIPPLEEFEEAAIPLNDFSGIPREIFYNWNMTTLGLLPSNKVYYFVKVFDNDRVSGFKESVSKVFYARVPSMYELFDEVKRDQDQNIVDLESVLDEGKKLKETLEKLQMELKKSKELGWEEKKALNEAVEKRNDLLEKVDKIEENLQKLAEKLEKNDMTAVETLEKYVELQKLLQELKSPELTEALKKLRESADKMNQQKLKAETEKMVMDNEEFLKKIERTLSILKHIQREQLLDELARKAEELVNRENEILEDLKKKNVDLNESAKRQDRIGEDIQRFEKDFEDIYKEMMSEPMVPQQTLDRVNKDIKSAEFQKLNSETRKNIQTGNLPQADKSGSEIKSELSKIQKQLQNAREQLVNNFKDKVRKELKKNSYDLLSLSEIQEQLKNATSKSQANSPDINKIAENLLDAMSGLNRVANNLLNLSNETFFVTPEMGKAISEAFIAMRNGLRALEERNPQQSSQQQSQSLGALNKAVIEINNALNSLKQAGSGGGLEEYLKRLAEMAQKQEGINRATIQIPGGDKEGNAYREQSQRIARDQEALRKTLEQLQNELGSRSQILGDLKKIADEMKEVSSEMGDARIDNRTLQKQERILSRLLDAQRSLHRSDYSRKRLAEQSKEYQISDPGVLPEDLGEKDLFFREQLRKALSEK
ncbi:DUF4175 family protein, partial [candidate division KSB1 bacterium]